MLVANCLALFLVLIDETGETDVTIGAVFIVVTGGFFVTGTGTFNFGVVVTGAINRLTGC